MRADKLRHQNIRLCVFITRVSHSIINKTPLLRLAFLRPRMGLRHCRLQTAARSAKSHLVSEMSKCMNPCYLCNLFTCLVDFKGHK